MKRSSLILWQATILFLLVACQPSQAPQQALPRPNLVLIIADDMGWNDFGAAGHLHIQTPNLDRMRAEGMRFTNGFLTTSSCSPSRSSIITGRYPHNTDAEQLHWALPGSQITFVEKLREAGYWTGAAGKWHLGKEVRGRFDTIFPAGLGDLPPPPRPSDVRSGCIQWQPLLQHRPKDQPFFLWLAAMDPHRAYEPGIIFRPHQAAEAVVPPYLPDLPEMREDLALYYDEITRLDSFVGVVFHELEAQGVADNTMILFISDNGRPFPRAKTTLYDSGIKSPWLVRWPAKVKAGSTCTSLVSAVDIASTFVELGKGELSQSFQGLSFAEMLTSPQIQNREFVFAEHNWHDFDDHSRATRSSRYKYIEHAYTDLANTPPADAISGISYQAMLQTYEAGELESSFLTTIEGPRPKEELYDLENDPFEMNNLAQDKEAAEVLILHQQALALWKKETGDAVPAFRTADEFDRRNGKPLGNWLSPRPNKAEMRRLGLIPPLVSDKEK